MEPPFPAFRKLAFSGFDDNPVKSTAMRGISKLFMVLLAGTGLCAAQTAVALSSPEFE
jgi:hypothetical protein